MSSHHGITEALPWDDILRRKSDVTCTTETRRDSLSSRRNSLYLSDTLLDFPLTPGVTRDHNLFTYNDPDPFAPLSYGGEQLPPLVPSMTRSSQTSMLVDRLLGERSESSIVSVPTIVSMGSSTGSNSMVRQQIDHYSSYAMNQQSLYDMNSYATANGSSNQLLNHLTMDLYHRNQVITPLETVSSSIRTATKESSRSTSMTTSSSRTLPEPKTAGKQTKSPSKSSRAKKRKLKDDIEKENDDGDDVEEDDDDDDDESGSNRFKPFHEEKWTLRYKELLDFHQIHGHAAVPHTYPANPQLARWVKRQRRQYKLRKDKRQSTMTTDRLDLLTDVGFVWDSHDVNWREKLDGLELYRREYGNCNVPSNFRDKKLATWVKCQRRQYKLYWDGKPSAMGPDRILELEKVGFEWEIRSTVSRPPSNTQNTSETTTMMIHDHHNSLHPHLRHQHTQKVVASMTPTKTDYYKDYFGVSVNL